MPNLTSDWQKRAEKRNLPARKILEAWMDKLRENEVELVREWDK